MNIASALREASHRLKKKGMESPDLDARVILSHVLDIPPFDLQLNSREEISSEKEKNFSKLVEMRENGMPCAYLLGRKEFWSLDFRLNPSTLIPRPETELIVEEALRILKENSLTAPKVLDLGTGSGAIAVSLAREVQAADLVATDISFEALLVARENARRHCVSSRIHFVQTDWLTSFKKLTGSCSFDLVTANPPYIGEDEIRTLDMNELRYEPGIALFSGRQGLNAISELLHNVPRILKPGGWFLCEIGFRQGEKANALAMETGCYRKVEILKDINSHDRMLKVQRK